MIDLISVSKRYGSVEAVTDITFHAPRGQIVGLLGQNGAGKTTTLNILTGYFPPTSGEVRVDGQDMLTHARECKRNIGYLPEKPPLYDEMTVRSYLRFVCQLKEVHPRGLKAHVEDVMRICGLTEVAGRVIGHLSKGYRQRVGIAQALCGDPPVLVLDEPTVGLDPRQVVEIRELIRSLGEKHTIIFSSHLLPEVQQLCQRVVILHRGRIAREIDMTSQDEGPGQLRLRAVIGAAPRDLMGPLQSLPCVQRARLVHSRDGRSEVLLDCRSDGSDAPQVQLFRLLCGLDAPLYALTPQRDSLEDAFLRITAEEG